MQRKRRPSVPARYDVSIHQGFWGHYRRIVRESVIPYQWQALNDQLPEAPPSHCIANMKRAAEKNRNGQASGSFKGMVFQDSDLYKWLEAVAYQLAATPDAKLESIAAETIELIGQAQEDDGYLDTYYTLVEPEKKWTNLMDNHELYCAGHMIEAAVAWHDAMDNSDFLSIACKNADLLCRVFGPDPKQIQGYPGHPEIEMALMRLHAVTGEKRYFDLADFFVQERGKTPSYFDQELKQRGQEKAWAHEVTRPQFKYYQAHRPLTEQDNLEGHSVRALYLLCGLIDVAQEKNDEQLLATAYRIFDHAVTRRMYVTGGVGSTHHGEAFTFDYHLPNDTVYAETCASIALIFAARRFLDHRLDRRYSDVMERALYNTCIGGMQLDGTRFLYVNPLQVWPEASEKDCDHWHVTPQRQKWFGCACCPPNLARLLASLGQYAYGQDESTLHVHLYVDSSARFEVGGQTATIECETRYPLDGVIRIHKKGPACSVALRIPDWCQDFELEVDGQSVSPTLENGYAFIDCAEGKATVDLSLGMEPVRVRANPAVPENAGKVCLQRGPLVYCLEEEDNGHQLWNLQLDRQASISSQYEADLLGGVVTLQAKGRRTLTPSEQLYTYDQKQEEKPVMLKFIPYYAWSNRSVGEMSVWLQE